tara:strand:- start:6564 stop:6926 length:363 start_codon:yes stop_codon:yes gene_type:complete
MNKSEQNEEAFYKLVKTTVREVSMSIIKEPKDVPIVTDEIVYMVHEFTEKIANTNREMNEKDFKAMDNIVTEALLKISAKLEHFLPTEEFINSVTLKIAFMSLKVLDIMQKEKDEQSRGD